MTWGKWLSLSTDFPSVKREMFSSTSLLTIPKSKSSENQVFPRPTGGRVDSKLCEALFITLSMNRHFTEEILVVDHIMYPSPHEGSYVMYGMGSLLFVLYSKGLDSQRHLDSQEFWKRHCGLLIKPISPGYGKIDRDQGLALDKC